MITGILVVAVLYFAREVFIPLALAGLLAFLLTPAAARLERWRVRRTPAALLVIFLTLAGIAATGWVVLGQIYNLAAELPQYQENISAKLDSLHLNSAGKLANTIDMLTNLQKQIKNGDSRTSAAPSTALRQEGTANRPPPAPISARKQAQPVSVRIEQPEESMTAMVGRTVMPLVHPLTTTLIVVIFLVFILLGREDLLDRGLRLAGIERMHITTTAIQDASKRVSRYLLMQLLVNMSYGLIAGVSLWLIGVPHPLLWGVLSCLLRFVPYIGIMMAAAGPLLLSIAVSPNWSMLAWTLLIFVVLEIATANFVEPMLYGASTGMSAIAVLTAAIFWTVLWGFPGLLLATPLTVCLVVVGQQVPHLRFLQVLFGEEKVLSPSERFYQRMLASNVPAARSLIEDLIKTGPRAEVYDNIIVPALSQIEDARHSEQITTPRAEEILQGIEELAEEVGGRAASIEKSDFDGMKRVAFIPARDFADEVGCQLSLQVMSGATPSQVMSADLSTPDLLQSIESFDPEVICVIGIPPHAMRHLRMRCQQIRTRLPRAVVVACLLSKESDLPNLRSRIAMEDAQHVAYSLQLLKEYITSLLCPTALPAGLPVEATENVAAIADLAETVQAVQRVDLPDDPQGNIFEGLATNLAKSLDAPIALFTAGGGERPFWGAQCGLGKDVLLDAEHGVDLSICSKVVFSNSTLVISDTAEEPCFAEDSFLSGKGVRFYAGAPLKSHDGEVIGSLCVLDTRPRQLTEQQMGLLTSVANAVMTAIELHRTGKLEEPAIQSDLTDQKVT